MNMQSPKKINIYNKQTSQTDEANDLHKPTKNRN